MIYQWKNGTRLTGDAQRAGEEIDAIRLGMGGMIEPKDVLKRARAKRSPLHPYFEWSDNHAAEAHRLSQARYLLRSIVVAAEEGEPEYFEPVRAFVSISETEEHPKAYVHIRAAMASPSMRSEVLEKARRELIAWRQRYADLKEFADLFGDIDGTLAGM